MFIYILIRRPVVWFHPLPGSGVLPVSKNKRSFNDLFDRY
jgi:hypothetical protein